jgi:elongation factor P hydroxylase
MPDNMSQNRAESERLIESIFISAFVKTVLAVFVKTGNEEIPLEPASKKVEYHRLFYEAKRGIIQYEQI